NGDEHRRNVLQEIFGLRALENLGVLFKFVGDLINNETSAIGQRIVRLLEQSARFVDLENAKRDSGNDIIAGVDTAFAQFQWQVSGVVVDDMHARILSKLTLQIARESGIELEQKQLTIRSHPARNFA